MKTYICKICLKPFPKTTNNVVCSESCLKEWSKVCYENRLYEKTCKYCNQKFKGTAKSRLCVHCRSTRKVAHQHIIKSVVCKKCNRKIGEREVPTKGRASVIKGNTCNECKKISRYNLSTRMKLNNPAIKRYGKAKERMSKEELSLRLSERMKRNNPMKRPEVRAKLKEMRRLHPQQFNIGIRHHLWKGKRNRQQTIRSRLWKPWIFPILQRDNFTCSRCGVRGGRLEVHHTKEKIYGYYKVFPR